MEILTQISPLGYSLVGFLFVLTIVVFFHELGHFMVARWCGVGVETFSVGFGKEIFGFTDKHNTRWKFSWIPLGGYVKFVGDENAASVPDNDAIKNMSPEERAVNFHAKPLWARAAVVAAGPIANFLLAIVIFAFMLTFIGQRITTPRVDEIQPGSAAEEAGFQPGDLITAIDGVTIATFRDMQRIVSVSADQTLTFTVDRAGSLVDLQATPKRKEITDNFGNTIKLGLLGIKRNAQNDSDIIVKTYDPLTAIWMGTKETYFVIARTLGYLYDIVVGRESADQLGGPIRIAQISGQVATTGILPLINLAAILSVSIGLLNLFPVPMLDGGHLLFYAIEAVRGRPLSEDMQEVGFRIGLVLILMLMIFATWNDVIHLFKNVL